MTFSPEQKAALEAPLSSTRVKARQQAGRSLSYIEGWWAISEANRIFGFDGWNRQTTDVHCVSEAPRKVGQGDGWGVTYTSKVRVMVGDIIREGCGTGHGIDRDKGQAHESAIKEAETDAMKRALMTFGNPFGLALYDKDQAGVENERSSGKPEAAAPSKPEYDQDPDGQVTAWCDKQKAVIAKAERLPDLFMWEDDVQDALKRLFRKSPKLHEDLMKVFNAKKSEISQKEAA